jgi:hypothetical protein
MHYPYQYCHARLKERIIILLEEEISLPLQIVK